MIKLTRIDDRLVHGQVALVWTPALSVDCLIVSNDLVAKDDFLKMTLGFAKPANTRLLIQSLPETIAFLKDFKSQSLNILIIINSVKDAVRLSDAIPEISSVNFGGIRGKEGSRLITKAIALTEEDEKQSHILLNKGIELEIRQVPTDRKQLLKDLL